MKDAKYYCEMQLLNQHTLAYNKSFNHFLIAH